MIIFVLVFLVAFTGNSADLLPKNEYLLDDNVLAKAWAFNISMGTNVNNPVSKDCIPAKIFEEYKHKLPLTYAIIQAGIIQRDFARQVALKNDLKVIDVELEKKINDMRPAYQQAVELIALHMPNHTI